MTPHDFRSYAFSYSGGEEPGLLTGALLGLLFGLVFLWGAGVL